MQIRPSRHAYRALSLPRAHAVFSSRQTAQVRKPIKLHPAKLHTPAPNCAGMHANFFWPKFQRPKKQASNFKPWCHSIGLFPINTESIGTTPSHFLHAFSYTMVEPNTGFVFGLNELVEDDPVDPNAPVNWDVITEDVFDFDKPLFQEEIEKGQFLFFLLSCISFIQSVYDPSSFVQIDEVTHAFDLNLPAEEGAEGKFPAVTILEYRLMHIYSSLSDLFLFIRCTS
jgi:hypothetical protein